MYNTIYNKQEGLKIFLAEAEGAKSTLPRMVKVGYKQLQLIYVRTVYTQPTGDRRPAYPGRSIDRSIGRSVGRSVDLHLQP